MKWFKHDSDANRDPKIEKVLMKYGAEGYALYWFCIELIVYEIDKAKITFELEHDVEVIAHRLKMDSLKVEEILRYFVEQHLFEIDPTSQRVVCMKIASRLEGSVVKNPKLKGIQEDIKRQAERSEKIPDNPGQPRLEVDVDKDIDIDKNISTGALNVSAWQQYLDYRKERGASKLTAQGEKLKIAQLANLTLAEQQACVDLTISNGWTGLFPEKQLKRAASRKPTYAEQLAADMAAKGM